MAVDGEHAGQRRCCASVGQSRAEESKSVMASECRDGTALTIRNSKGCFTGTYGTLGNTELYRRLIKGIRQ